MGEFHSDLAHEVALATGAAASTDITVPRITNQDVVKSIFGRNTTTNAITDRTADLTLVGNGVIQLSSVSTGEVLTILWNKHSPEGKSLVDPASSLYVGPGT